MDLYDLIHAWVCYWCGTANLWAPHGCLGCGADTPSLVGGPTELRES